MFYVGTWASSIDFDADDADIEIDYYAGITPTWGPVSFDFGWLYYNYPSDSVTSIIGSSRLTQAWS